MKMRILVFFMLCSVITLPLTADALTTAWHSHYTKIHGSGARESHSHTTLSKNQQRYKFHKATSTCGGKSGNGGKKKLGVKSDGTSWCSIWDGTSQKAFWYKK